MSRITKNKLAILALAGIGAFTTGTAAATMTVDSNGGLEVFELDNTDFWFKIGGRLHFTSAFYNGGSDERSKFPDGSMIRSARVTFKGGVGDAWIYKLDLDFVDSALGRPVGQNAATATHGGYTYAVNSPNTVNIFGDSGAVYFGEAFIGYNGCKNIWFAGGQISIPFGLESWASSNDGSFMEVSAPSQAFDNPALGLGLYGEWHNNYFTVATAMYAPRAGTTQYGDSISTAPYSLVPANVAPATGPLGSDAGSDPLGLGGRITFSPKHDDFTVYHLGFSAKYQNLHNRANIQNWGASPEIANKQSPILFTNVPLNSVNNFYTIGLEAAGRWGPFMISGEYMHTKADREEIFLIGDQRQPGGDLTYHGYYFMASYIITREARDYDFVSGTFGRVRPRSHKGAWEVAIRHSYLSLIDDGKFVPGSASLVNPVPRALPAGVGVNAIVGSMHNTTVGLNYWVNDHIRFLANYSRINMPNSIDVNAWGIKGVVNW